MQYRVHLALFLVCIVMGSRLFSHTIVIDPGHGGPYSGTVSASGSIIEKNMVLTLAQKLAERLRERGYTVYLTRDSDEVLDKDHLMNDLKKRAQMTTDYQADLFISLHLNGSSNKNICGYEVYVPYEDKFPIKSYSLAGAVHYELSHKLEPRFGGGTLGNLNAIDRGIRASRFNVIKKATCPAVLVELAYLSHPGSAQKLLSSEYKDKLVDALYCGVRRYLIHAKKSAH